MRPPVVTTGDFDPVAQLCELQAGPIHHFQLLLFHIIGAISGLHRDYRVYIGVILRVYIGVNIGIMEKEMETTGIMGLI